MKRKTLIALIIAIPLGGGCAAREHAYRSTQSGGPQNLGTIDACSLLSQEEMSVAVGVPMNSGRHNLPGTTQQCTWQRPFPQRVSPPATLDRLELFVEPADGFEWDKHNVSQENVTSVSGLGEEAYYTEHPHVLMYLTVKKGDLCVIVTWIGVTTDRQQVMDAEKTIAAQVLSKL